MGILNQNSRRGITERENIPILGQWTFIIQIQDAIYLEKSEEKKCSITNHFNKPNFKYHPISKLARKFRVTIQKFETDFIIYEWYSVIFNWKIHFLEGNKDETSWMCLTVCSPNPKNQFNAIFQKSFLLNILFKIIFGIRNDCS